MKKKNYNFGRPEKYDDYIIYEALVLYKKMSARKVKAILFEMFHRNIAFNTILYWKKKYDNSVNFMKSLSIENIFWIYNRELALLIGNLDKAMVLHGKSLLQKM